MDEPFNSKTVITLCGLIATTVLATIGALLLLEPIPQDLCYHAFADQRQLFGVPRFGDVVSNFPFLLVAILGLRAVYRARLIDRAGDSVSLHPYTVFFTAVGLVAAGSAYYHYHPDNERLVWDRLPMTIAFMSLFSLIISERIHPVISTYWAMPGLIMLGMASVFYWHFSERAGHGDLRFYGLVQFYPPLAIPVICVLFPNRSGLSAGYLIGLLLCYVLAKAFEHLDYEVYALTRESISGHTLKHLSAALGCCFVLTALKRTQRAQP
ncbi:MAG: ceramidase domain-containing protein [Gammaproteobacteria bacterium]